MYRDHEKRRGLWLLLLLAVRSRQPFGHRIERGEKVSELVRAVYESREKALSGGDLARIENELAGVAGRLKDHETRLLRLERGRYRTYP